jgi:hypothetical protein
MLQGEDILVFALKNPVPYDEFDALNKSLSNDFVNRFTS